jgi:hypothetical protein
MAGVDDDKKASERGLFLFDFDGGEFYFCISMKYE